MLGLPTCSFETPNPFTVLAEGNAVGGADLSPAVQPDVECAHGNDGTA